MRPKVSETMVSGSIGMISRVAAQVCLLGVTLTATRVLAVSAFGVYSIASALMVLSRNLFYVGPYEYLLKSPEEFGLKGACLKANLCLAALSMTILSLFAAVSEGLFHSTALPHLILYLVPSLLISAITAWYEANLLRQLAVRRYYLFTVIGELVAAGASIGCFLLGLGIVSLIVQIYVRLIVLLTIYAWSSPGSDWRGGDREQVETVLRWSWSRYGAVFLNFSANYGADFVLGVVLSPVATGIYRASNRIVTSVSDLFAQPLQKIVQTNLSARSARGLPPDQAWIGMLLGLAAIGWATLAGLAVSAWAVVPVVMGPAWTNAVPVVIVFCFMRAISLIDAATACLLVCCDRQHFMLTVQSIVAMAVPASSLVLAHFGPGSTAEAPVVVALGNAMIMCGLTITYGREAARLSRSGLVEIVRAFLPAMVPGIVVVVSISGLNALHLWGHAAPREVVGMLVGAGAIGLACGLLLIWRHLAASMASLAEPARIPECSL